MKKKFILILAVLFVLGFESMVAQVSTGLKPICLDAPSLRGARTLAVQTVKIANLKAVLIVGQSESLTASFIKEMKEYAKVLKDRGVTCYEFYYPYNSWTDIVKAAEGAHFLIYAGHGLSNGTDIPEWVGTYYLGDDYVKADRMKSDLKLAEGAIVMFNHACFSAGAAGSDASQIAVSEAKRRVSLYSAPFLEEGISAYYASSWNNGLSSIIIDLFAGKTFGEAYKGYTMYVPESTIKSKHPNKATYDQWLNNGFTYAFVGNSNKTLSDIFGN